MLYHYLTCFIQSSKPPSDAVQNIEKSKMSTKAKQKKHRSTGLALNYFEVIF